MAQCNLLGEKLCSDQLFLIKSNILQKLIQFYNCFPGEIINPWTGGRLQLSDEIDENSAQDGKSKYFYSFFVNTDEKLLHAPKIWHKKGRIFMFPA